MSEKREFVAVSLRDAINQAAEAFAVPEEKLQYRVITEKTKYFGHKQREIYIEAWAQGTGEATGVQEFLAQFVAALKMDLEFTLEDTPTFLRVNFSGEDYRLMLHQNGNLLNAVQYLLNRLYSDGVGKKIYCECQNYRKKKEVELSALAHRYARQVRKSGRPVNLPEMNPFERRVIHMTINRYSDLESRSEGETFLKVITIQKKANG